MRGLLITLIVFSAGRSRRLPLYFMSTRNIIKRVFSFPEFTTKACDLDLAAIAARIALIAAVCSTPTIYLLVAMTWKSLPFLVLIWLVLPLAYVPLLVLYQRKPTVRLRKDFSIEFTNAETLDRKLLRASAISIALFAFQSVAWGVLFFDISTRSGR